MILVDRARATFQVRSRFRRDDVGADLDDPAEEVLYRVDQSPFLDASDDVMTLEQIRFLVLHAVRVSGRATSETVAAISGIAMSSADEALAHLASEMLVEERAPRSSGWRVTDKGRARHADLVARELAEGGCRDEVERAYRDFLILNPMFKAICTDWQLRDVGGERITNDHSDDKWDERCIARLGIVHRKALPLVRRLASLLPRFRTYDGRLTSAWERVVAGDRAAVAQPLCDSYHDMWMQLHEDLMTTLAKQRDASDGE